MGLRNLGHVPGEKKLVVNSQPGPTAYARGTGVVVRMDFKTVSELHDIVGVWQLPVPYYSLAVHSFTQNRVRVLLGYNVNLGGKFVEVSAGVNVADVSVFVAAMGR